MSTTTTTSSTMGPEEVDRRIVRQVEYYFSDMNLPKDKFLQEETKKDDGWIPIQTLATFNRLKALSTDVDAISAALKKSNISLVEVSEDNTKVRRSKDKPVAENRIDFWREMKHRTIYVKGFPGETQMDELMDFFEKYGKVVNIVMRRLRDEKKTFKGSVFVTFETHELCKSIVAMENLKYKDTELIKMLENEYHQKKSEERAEHKKLKHQQKESVAKRNEKDKKEQGENAKKIDDNDGEFTKGLVIHLTGLGDIKDVNRDDMRTTFNKFGQVDWIDFNRGDKEAWIRFKGEADEAENVVKKWKDENGGKSVYKEVECEVTVLTGDAEQAYWVKTRKNKREALERKSKGKKHGGKKFDGKNDRRRDNKWSRDNRRGDKKREKKESENGTKAKDQEMKETEGEAKSKHQEMEGIKNGTTAEEQETKEKTENGTKADVAATGGVKRPASMSADKSECKETDSKPTATDESPAAKIAKVE